MSRLNKRGGNQRGGNQRDWSHNSPHLPTRVFVVSGSQAPISDYSSEKVWKHIGRVAKRSRVSSYGHVDYSAVLSLTLSKLRGLGAHHSNAVFLFVLSTVGTLSGKL